MEDLGSCGGQQAGGGPWTGRFSVSIYFRMPQARNANEVWDLDNLIKPS